MATPLTPRTLVYGLSQAGDPQVSPDGTRIAFTLAKVDEATNKTTSHIWLMDVDGQNRRQLTRTGSRHGWPRWSPDGSHLAFTSDRPGDDRTGLYVLPLAGGEAREVTCWHGAINDVAWSPDGRSLAFTAQVDPENPTGEPAKPGSAPRVRVVRRIDYKQDVLGYLGEARSQLFLVDVASGERRQLTCDPDQHSGFAFNPHGTKVAVRVNRKNGLESKLQILSVSGEGEPLEIGASVSSVGNWAWSPDGGRIVFFGDPGHTWQPDVYQYHLAMGEETRLTDDLPCLPDAGFANVLPPAQPVFLDDWTVLFSAVHHGASGLWTIDLRRREVRQLEGASELRSGMSTDARHEVIAFAVASPGCVGEIGVVQRGPEMKRAVVTDYSASVFAGSPPAAWERFDVVRDGSTTEAWLLKPADFDPGKRYPVILDVHGGPNGYYGYGFNAIQQALATHGFLVVYSNPRGSTSYGRAFTGQVMGDWGGEDFLDLMAVVDAVLERPYADPSRTGIWGYSYGGYMTAWTISQVDRFRAAVCGAPCFDLEAMYGTSDISHLFGPLQWGGKPHEAREWYAARSPSSFGHRTKTPTLIIHGEADERCPIGQGEQMFVTLHENGCETEFVRYPGGSHQFMRLGPPEHREDVIQRVLGWFQRHLKGED